MTGARPTLRAVIFDLGGVVLDSPLAAIAAYEADNRISPGSINRAIAARGEEGAWAGHERGELDFSLFCDRLEAECAEEGILIDAAELMARIELTIRPRPAMVQAIRRLRAAGVMVAALTNSWATMGDPGVDDEFDVVVHSWREGVRKPHPEIYRRALERLEVVAQEAVFLDDIGVNVKAARQMGMTTIKVDEPEVALAELAALLSVPL